MLGAELVLVIAFGLSMFSVGVAVGDMLREQKPIRLTWESKPKTAQAPSAK